MGRRKTSDFLSLEEVGRLGGGRSFEPLSRLAVFNAWGRAVGPTLRAVTRPVRLLNRKLTVEVGGPAWHLELERLKSRIHEQLNALLPPGSVTWLIFTPRAAFAREVERQAGAALQPLLPFEGPPEHRAASISKMPIGPGSAEDDLRERFEAVASRYLKKRA